MKVINNIKLFVISLLFLAVSIQAQSGNNVGDIRSERTDDKWICDMIECPVDADRCFASKSNEEERSVLKHVNICFSTDNTILAQKETSSPINPNNNVRQYVNFYRNGGVYTSADKSAINKDEKTFNEDMKRIREHVESEVKKMREDMERMKRDFERRFMRRH